MIVGLTIKQRRYEIKKMKKIVDELELLRRKCEKESHYEAELYLSNAKKSIEVDIKEEEDEIWRAKNNVC